LAELLREFDDVVNTSKTLPTQPATNDVFHHIQTSGPPISSKFRCLDEEKLRAAKLEFEQLEKDGVVRRSDSRWALPLHMVQKADGSWRPCGNYRRLNLVTQPDSYPLPNMLDFANDAAGKQDLFEEGVSSNPHASRRHLQNSHHNSIWPVQVYQYAVWSLHASNTFQHKMDRVKNKLAFCFAFQNDLEVESHTNQEHRQHLHTIFLHSREHGLVINAEKCIFCVPSIDFLGHRVTPLLQYISAAVDFPQPSTVKELQAFLGMLNFYRRFLPAIANILVCSQTL
jgi:hypothetical protein